MGIELDLFFVWGSKLTSLLCAGRKLIGFNLCGWSKLTSFERGGSKSTWFQCGDQNSLGVCVEVENDLVLLSRSKLNWFLSRFLCRGIKIDMNLEWRSKLT